MALTFRTNGSGAANVVGASWWDDYFNLLTGVMTDQPVTLSYSPGSSTSTPTLTVKTNGNAPLLSLNNGSSPQFSVDANGNVNNTGYIIALGGITTQGQLTSGLSTTNFSTKAAPSILAQGFFSSLSIFCDSTNNNWSFMPGNAPGFARGMMLYGLDTGGSNHLGLSIDGATGLGHLTAKDGGTYRGIAFYEGTGTPTGQNEGDIWFDG